MSGKKIRGETLWSGAGRTETEELKLNNLQPERDEAGTGSNRRFIKKDAVYLNTIQPEHYDRSRE